MPSVEVNLLDLLNRDRLRQVHRLRDRAGQERLQRLHHLEVPLSGDRTLTNRAVEHGQVMLSDPRSTHDRPVLHHVLGELIDVLVAETTQGVGHALVDDAHGAATDQSLVLHQRKVRLDPRRVTVHHERDRPCRRGQRHLCVPQSVIIRGIRSAFPHIGDVIHVGAVHAKGIAAVPKETVRHPVLLQHAGVGLLVHVLVLEVRPDPLGEGSRRDVRLSRHRRCDLGGDHAALVAVVRQPHTHEHRPEVGHAEPELPVLLGVLADLLRREVTERHRDVHRPHGHVHSAEERIDFEAPFLVHELHEVERS